jgi:hypothetical protein
MAWITLTAKMAANACSLKIADTILAEWDIWYYLSSVARSDFLPSARSLFCAYSISARATPLDKCELQKKKNCVSQKCYIPYILIYWCLLKYK